MTRPYVPQSMRALDDAGERRHSLERAGERLILPRHLDMRDEARDDDQIEGSLAEHLVGDVDLIVGLGLASLWHVPIPPFPKDHDHEVHPNLPARVRCDESYGAPHGHHRRLDRTSRRVPRPRHALLGRTHGGRAILVTGHLHADTVAVLRESEPGVFVMGNEPSAFPVAISISMPEPGRLIHVWSYGAPGEEPIDRDRAELTLST